MEDREFDRAWEEARGKLFAAVPPPSRAETEAFARRVLARLPEEPVAWLPWRWVVPSAAFSAAALALSLSLPADDAAETAFSAASPAVASWAAAPASAEDLLGFAAEDR